MTVIVAPTWQDGELLSATKLNQITDATNAIKGASMAPTAIFMQTGDDKTYYCRRRYRYLHVTWYNTGSPTFTVKINGTTVYTDTTARTSAYTTTIDLSGLGSPPTVGTWYSILVTCSGETAYRLIELRESSASSPTGTGSYVSPPTWTATEVVGATKLNTLRDSIASLAEVTESPSCTWLRATDSQYYRMRRRQRYLNVNYIATNSPSVQMFVNGTLAVATDTTEYPSGTTKTIDLAGVSGGPAVGDFYSLEFRRNSGNVMVGFIVETIAPTATYAPTWAEGDTLPNDTNIDKYAAILNAAYAITGAVGWQFATIDAQVGQHPQWAFYKTKRYLHYRRNGSTSALLIDPAGVEDDISLSGTGDAFGTYDLDSIGWLTPGGLLLGYEFDAIWLDDEAG